MHPDFPAHLYKYCPPDRLDILECRLARYTPIGAFNDPFEGRPEVTGLATADETISRLENLLPDETRQMYELLPAHIQDTISYQQVFFMAKALLQAKASDIQANIQSLTPTVMAFLDGKLDTTLGALCLSEVPDSLLMWAHYAASHTGFVVEFAAQHSHFHEARTPVDEFRRIRRVLYRDTRPSAPLNAMSASELFLVKGASWAYEREWRIMRALTEAAKTVPATPYPIHLFGFPPEAVSGVIIGARATPETVVRIRAVLAGPEWRHVRLVRALPDSKHFHLQLSDGDTA